MSQMKPTPKRKMGMPTVFVALALLSANVAHAEPKRHVPYKQAAIFGSVFTWTYALATGAPLTQCKPTGTHMRVEYGEDAELNVKTVGLYTHNCLIKQYDTWRLSHTPMLNLTHWAGDSTSENSRSTFDIAAIPMLRWEKTFGFMPYPVDFELGVGFSYLNDVNIGTREKSTKFQFTDHSGIGFSSPNRDWRVGFAFRHLSNLGLKLPNNGANFFGASFEMKFD